MVGCGGSGGATLAYLMDQLRSDLAAHGVGRLPRGWQFVHMDVPGTPEPGPDGLGNVVDQGGHYFGTAPKDAVFRVLDRAVRQRFAEHQQEDQLSTWAPREPDKVAIPIGVGAGQYRAVGRIITLSRAGEILRTLRAAWDELFRVETTTEMTGLHVPGLGDYDDGPPLVFVVSSMAGGAGASMALDVCRLLTLIPGVDPEMIGVFMVAPNIFDAIPEASRSGVRPNALAMLGEIIASQTGSARAHDVEALATLGLQEGQGAPVPFRRVFPVGRFAGVERMMFGNGRPEAVYRGLGRGLAGMIMSGSATSEFVAYDLTNPDPPGDRDLLGWGSDWAPLPWGSYGFASLSMGRDRYAEYAAQRLARAGVDRLLDGHLQPGSTTPPNDQVANLLDSQWREACGRVQLPVPDPGLNAERQVGAWLTQQVFPRAVVEARAAAVRDREIRDAVPDPTGQQPQQWEQVVRGRMAERRSRILESAVAEAASLAFTWHQELRARIEQEVVDGVSLLGLSYAAAFVERLGTQLRTVVAPGAEQLTQYAPGDAAGVPPEVSSRVAGMPRGVLADGGDLLGELMTGFRDQLRTQMYATLSGLVRDLLDGLVGDVLDPLLSALGESQRVLNRARSAPVGDFGVAVLATDQYGAWPSDADERVPVRFDQAYNEVLLTTSHDFPAQYLSDVRRAVGAGTEVFTAARDEIVREVLAGVWTSVDAGHAPGSPLEQRAPWRSRVFAVEPGTGRALVPSQARYDLHVAPGEILDRARRFVSRRGESFDAFCRLSISEFVRGSSGVVTDLELSDRRTLVVEKFTETLTLARPLISVNTVALQTVHDGAQVEYRYKFSEIPFDGLTVADDLRRTVKNDPAIDASSSSTLDRALGDSTGVTRIDVFGSYPNYSPLVFDAVLAPAAEQWARTADMGREAFWQWRRARPLAAALPMGVAERRAMVAGWFIGQVTGRLRLPEKPFTRPVQIFDVAHEGTGEEGKWLDFPHPLLTPPSRFLKLYDWLPAVLESLLLAVARSGEAPVMASLRPYIALRGLYDDTPRDPVGGIHVLSARTLLGDWVLDRLPTGGGVSRVEGLAVAAGPSERAKAAVEWLQPIRELSQRYLTDNGAGARRGGVDRTPLFRDLAADVNVVLAEIIEILSEVPRDPDDDPVRGMTF